MAPLIPLAYRLFFLYLEPILTLLGAVSACFTPADYLALTDPNSSLIPSSMSVLDGLLTQPASPTIETPVAIILRQLANLYLIFGLIEATVLRVTSDRTVWRALLLVFLLGDFGHLAACYPKGWDIYFSVSRWNRMDYGNIGAVYACVVARLCFLAGIGMNASGPGHANRDTNTPTSRMAPGQDLTKLAGRTGPNTKVTRSRAQTPATDHDTITVNTGNDAAMTTPKSKRGRKKKVQ